MTSSAEVEPTGRRRSAWAWLPSIVVAVVLGVVVADRWSSLPPGERLPTVAAGLVAVALHVVGNVLLAVGWHRQILLAGQSVPLGPAAAVWSSSQLSRFVVPGATFGARAVLARRLEVPAATAAATTVFELGWTVLAHPVVVLAALPLWADLPDSLRWVGLAALPPVAVLVALVVAPMHAVVALATVLRRLPVIGRRVPDRSRLAQADLRRRDAAGLASIYLVNVVSRDVAFLVLMASMQPLDVAAVAAVVGASSLGRFVGTVSVFAPAGIGPREGATVLALASVTGAAPAVVAVAATRVAEALAEAALWLATRRWARSARR